MKQLRREDLMSLEAYAGARAAFRARVIAHKQARKIHLGEHATVQFEDRLTVQYQIQEMLRIERIFEAPGIEDELSAYNPLIPDGANLKATLMLEYTDVAQRREALAELKGIEDRVWVAVNGGARVFALADEDLERENEDKTSAVHFLRFELSADDCAALKAGAMLAVGCDHRAYSCRVDPVDATTRDALAGDLD